MDPYEWAQNSFTWLVANVYTDNIKFLLALEKYRVLYLAAFYITLFSIYFILSLSFSLEYPRWIYWTTKPTVNSIHTVTVCLNRSFIQCHTILYMVRKSDCKSKVQVCFLFKSSLLSHQWHRNGPERIQMW